MTDNDQPIHLDPATCHAIAAALRASVAGEYPASPQQVGAFTATSSWAAWIDQQAENEDARL